MKRKPTTVLLNYATPEFKQAQLRNARTGKEIGGFDRVISCGPKDLSRRFRRQNSQVLSEKRGGGLWLWKPYIILKTLKKLKEEDIVFYCDAGAHFISAAKPLITLAQTEHDIICFNVGYLDRQWSKRDAFVLMDCDSPAYVDTAMRLAGFIVARRSESSLKFFQEYLTYASDWRIVSDAPNTTALPNYDGFRENRHDQTVFSLLTKKWGFPCYRDPSVGPEVGYANIVDSPYPQIVQLTRSRNAVPRSRLSIFLERGQRKIASYFASDQR